jgi:hypothetical protein
MYYYFPVTGPVQKITKEEAIKKMDEISSQWEDESYPIGRLILGVFDWAFSKGENGIDIDIPNLRTGGSIPKNSNASLILGTEVFGDCFIDPKKDQTAKIDLFIQQKNN